MASPRTITIMALSVALGLFFVFMGTIKLTPRLSKDAYSEMLGRNSWTESDFFVGYAGSNCFGAAACRLGEGYPAKTPNFKSSRRLRPA